MIQLNTSYPATAYLTGFLRQHEARLGFTVSQADPAIELFLRLFCRAGLERVVGELGRRARARSIRCGKRSRGRRPWSTRSSTRSRPIYRNSTARILSV